MERKYPVSGYEGYFATESGDIISYKRGQRAIKRLQKLVNGEEGIRTPGAREDTPVFKTGAINHSTTSPESFYEPLPTFS